jgi:hypothetical protein
MIEVYVFVEQRDDSVENMNTGLSSSLSFDFHDSLAKLKGIHHCPVPSRLLPHVRRITMEVNMKRCKCLSIVQKACQTMRLEGAYPLAVNRGQ